MPIVNNQFVPESDINGRRKDGRGYLIWPAHKPMPLTQAYDLGLLKRQEARIPAEVKIEKRQREETDGLVFAGPDIVEDVPVFDATETAKKLAKEYGVDLTKIEGSGVNGRITKRDVAQFIEANLQT